jgi:hypothetical protein
VADPWPEDLRPLFGSAVTAEFAGLTRAGAPVTVPTTPYVGAGTLDLSTGLTYPAKAERARRDPRVCLLFADPDGTGLVDPPVACVQGLATVRDADLQANTDRYVRLAGAKLPDATKGQPRFVLRRMAWYYARIWVEVTPLVVRTWTDRSLADGPTVWRAPADTVAPPSDPAPDGAAPPPWLAPPDDWSTTAAFALGHLHRCDLTVTDADGWPLCLPAASAADHPDGFALTFGPGAPAWAGGPACVTFHDHPVPFTGQRNRTFLGRVDPAGAGGGSVVVRVDRALADWSLAGNRAQVALGFLGKGRRLRPRLRSEARRRGQPVPKVRFPEDRRDEG